MKRKILYINNGSGLSDVQSGGTLRHIETARVVKDSFEIYSLTTIGGSGNYKNSKLEFKKEYIVKSHLWKNKESSNYDRIFSYLVSTVESIWLVLTKKLPKADYVYSTSDYFCDTIPALFYKSFYKAKYVSMVHHRAKNPFKRSGNFLLNTLSFVFQRLSFFIIRVFSDGLLVYDTPEGVEIAKQIKPKRYFFVKNGINLREINKTEPQEKKYDVSFSGGLRETKGIYDLIPIFKKVVKKHPNIKVVICGGGTKVITEDFEKRLEKENLLDNFELLGALKPKKLYRVIKSSKILLSTSHEEGWGISVLEAVALGVPVVSYNLPAFKYLGDIIVKVKLFNYGLVASKISNLLENTSYIKKISKKGVGFAKDYGWYQIGLEEVEVLNEI